MRVRTIVKALSGAAVVTTLASVTVLGSMTGAMADGGPVVSSVDVGDAQVILYATVGSSLVLSVNVVPGSSGQPVTGVHAVLTAGLVRPGAVNTTTADLTSTDGLHWTDAVPIARTASPGSWKVTVTATDAAAAQGTAVASFAVRLNTHLSVSFTPGDPVAGGYLTFNGTLTRMQPATDPAADGRYVPYAGEYVGLEVPGSGRWADVTDSGGRYHVTAPASPGSWDVNFDGTIYHATSYADTKSITLQAKPTGLATRFSFFDASPEPAYYHGYVHFHGTLQHQDSHGNWLPYAGKAVTLYRQGLSAYQNTATTDSDGNFSASVRGSAATDPGTWYALFVGTINYRGTLSHGDYVPTITPPVRITAISANPQGSDSPVTNTKLNEEYVTLTNEGDHYANVNGWSVRDKAGHLYYLDGKIYIPGGHSITIHTGSGTNTATQFYWGSSTYIWNNDGDTAYLRDDFLTTVSTFTYG